VAPLFGPNAHGPAFDQSGARIVVFRTGRGFMGGRWRPEPVAERPVLHAIKVLDYNDDGHVEILTADNLGVALLERDSGFDGGWTGRRLISGASGDAPKRGSSEIQLGRLADGRRFLVTIDPWHGNEVAVCLAEGPATFGPRTVLDAGLKDGHALWVADVDRDGDDEIFAGYRGDGTSLLAFDYDGKNWTRSILDSAIAAQDLRGGDFNGDGVPDIVAIGGKTHNVVWYRPLRGPNP
jgi:hypothetical protein